MTLLSPEFKFIRDVIRYVLSDYWPGTHWNPSGMFLNRDSDSPFTPVMQEIIKDILEDHALDLHMCYDAYFPDKNITSKQHYKLCKEKSEKMMEDNYEDILYKFIVVCAFLSLFTALSVVYGVDDAPIITHRVILRQFESLKNANVITDTFWDDLQSASYG
ncbi:hypothetical protein TNCT_704571 [Trichonephila clavata]|uniref:Uncharacterized protein n=1 Tax=Trichonephila clavata TaxID=2740835 RepID=A0A8X6FNZ9_TRICU|nr:hypothetical protein TNCT_704571 [Trichonephila clavata]